MAANSSRLALIVGAGIGGVAAGVALQRAGWRVRVFERTLHTRELGFALLLAPNAVASLQRLGLAERVIAEGSEMTSGEIHGRAGRLLRRFDMARMRDLLPHPAVVFLRPALHGVLLDALGPANLSLGSEVRELSVYGSKPTVTLTNGHTAKGDVVIGADGVGSVIRRILHPDEPPPRRSGLWAIRGVAHGVESHVTGLAGAQYFGWGTEAGIARAGRDAVYWYISLPADQLMHSRDPQTIARHCADQFDSRFRAIVSATNGEDMRLDELLDRDPVLHWGRGPVTLLGDAAHPMLPHAGQGAAIGHVLDGAVEINGALRRYEQVRARRARKIVGIARRNARLGSISSPIGQRLRDVVIRIAPASVFTKAYIEFGNPPAVVIEGTHRSHSIQPHDDR
jgi:2-polyprenyl-6-methoxyphenol hydroxylase-like FAD-dependent oxidoreductase